jgi:predicted nucleic acid-binding protein
VQDEPDTCILKYAADAGSEFIVTEDRALSRLKQYGSAKLVTATES